MKSFLLKQKHFLILAGCISFIFSTVSCIKEEEKILPEDKTHRCRRYPSASGKSFCLQPADTKSGSVASNKERIRHNVRSSCRFSDQLE